LALTVVSAAEMPVLPKYHESLRLFVRALVFSEPEAKRRVQTVDQYQHDTGSLSMTFKSMLAAAAIVSMAATPAMAASNPASSLSIAPAARASAPVGKTNKAVGGGVLAALIAAGVVAIVVIAASKNDSPDSN
jgi:hypothetical protein